MNFDNLLTALTSTSHVQCTLRPIHNSTWQVALLNSLFDTNQPNSLWDELGTVVAYFALLLSSLP